MSGNDDANDWRELIYQRAWQNKVPWDDGCPHPMLVDWLERRGHLKGKAALDVGCGLGYNAEALASFGYQVTACDIAPTAILMCNYYHPSSSVRYLVADAFNPPSAWCKQGYDLVFEAGFLQVLPNPGPALELALRSLCAFVKPGGRLVTICRLRRPGTPQKGKTPWHFVQSEVEGLVSGAGLHLEECFRRRQGDVVRALLAFTRPKHSR